ncbi:major capsid protein [Anaerocolumna sp. AGMB13025]|uniref:major capsid protein n=1 Tax=Anaerocolumna sp. AGMB13025 TaxID=3039116 RepID=UPI00241F3CBB|nr:major capsid protein [Anaerocolumna sp. AGMB13025]WFR55363.1 major capsid protein [Anaerocolumna sp. AGMB13025]
MPDYTTREMLDALEQTPPVRTFLSRTFFPGSNTHVAETIEIDVKKGKRKMAPFVSPRKGGKVMVRDGFKTNTIKTPKIAPERAITVDDITKRSIGENVYTRRTPEEREDELLAQDMTDLQEAIERRKEWEAREVLLSGNFRVVDEEEGLDVQVDYNFTNKEILAGEETWDKESSEPIDLLSEKRRYIIQKTGISPDIIIMAADAAKAFMKHPKVREAMDIRNLKNVVIEPLIIDPALTFIGKISEIGCEIYTYDEWYLDDDGDEQPIIPEGTVIIASSKGIGSFEYGAVTQMEEGKFITYEAEVVPKMWPDNENEVKKLRMTSRPVPRPYDVDSWYVLTVL